MYFLIFCIGDRKECQTTRTFRILLGIGGEEGGYLQITICMGKMFSVKHFSRILKDFGKIVMMTIKGFFDGLRFY